MKKVSVIMPVYNLGNTITKAIESLLSQMYFDIELILVNDGSTDNSLLICEKYAAIDRRIKIVNQTNHGVSNARNSGLKIATGEYIGFVDGDDWIDSEFYLLLVETLEKYDADIVISSVICEFKNGKKKCFSEKKNILQLRSEEALRCMFKNEPFGGFLCNRLYKRSILKDQYLDENIHMCEDALFSVDIFIKAKKIIYYPSVNYHYYQSGESMTTGGFSPKKCTGINAYESILEKICIQYPNLYGLVKHNLLIIKIDCYIAAIKSDIASVQGTCGDKYNLRWGILTQIFKGYFSFREVIKAIIVFLPTNIIRTIFRVSKKVRLTEKAWK